MALTLSGTAGVAASGPVTTAGLTTQTATFAGQQTTTSGTSKDFTGIPSSTKRITLIFDSVSVSGSAVFSVQLGSGSLTTTGYISTSGIFNNSNQTLLANLTTGFVIYTATSTNVIRGSISFVLVGGNTWISSHCGSLISSGSSFYSLSGGGSVTISGAIDRLRFTTNNGTDTFTAGSINVIYETF